MKFWYVFFCLNSSNLAALKKVTTPIENINIFITKSYKSDDIL